MSDGGGEGGKRSGGGRQAPILEWVLAAVGLTVACGIVGYLLFLGVGTGSGPPDLQVRPARVTQQHDSHLVIVEVENAGGSPAAAVQVEGRLFEGGEDIQTSQVTIDYVPIDGTADGGLVFTEPPGEFELRLRVLGYQTP